MTRKAVITLGLGYGDEGKGSVVDYLCRAMNADLVVRYCGGCQAAHHVVLPDGRSHCFSQFGAGTLAGSRTWLHKNMIVNPVAMENEAKHLQELGIANPWSSLFVHPQCLVATPYHIGANRTRESHREAQGVERHGSCGMGIGECRGYALKYPNLAIRVVDLRTPTMLLFKLTSLLRYYEREFGSSETLLYPEEIVERYLEIGQVMNITDRVTCDTAVFEGSQGMLIDEMFGTAPYNTWSDVTLRAAKEALRDLEIEKTFKLGITRSYATRHGPGPFPSEVENATLVGDHNDTNEWQGKFRLGKFDVASIAYAVIHAGAKLDGIAVTCLDNQPLGCEIDQEECIESIELATETLVTLTSHGPTWQDKKATRGMVSQKLMDFMGSTCAQS